jgi:extracellular factor (EF) 3-hydroxypalmitic acid methyl ester biosynthesis protein
MNMIHRNTFEGASLYAKMVHFWLVKQWAAQSVRNRVAHMKARLLEETLRVSREKRPARFMSLGCGPAREVQDFMTESALSDLADFTLVDFDPETLDHVASTINRAKTHHGRQTAVHVRRLAANDIVKFSTQPSRNPLGANFDMIYCGGLFDYLSDRLCKKLVGIFYDWLAPGGRLVVANMHDQRKPFRYMVELMLDWHLIYRDVSCMSTFLPEQVRADSWSVVHEPVAANLFLEVRKPDKSY